MYSCTVYCIVDYKMKSRTINIVNTIAISFNKACSSNIIEFNQHNCLKKTYRIYYHGE